MFNMEQGLCAVMLIHLTLYNLPDFPSLYILENIVVSGHRLRIRSASRADAANFTCTVFNEAGAVTSTAEIRVLDTGALYLFI